MYRFFRNIHLGVGLFVAVFLTAYALSAAQMAYWPGYSRPATVVDVRIDIPPDVDKAPRAFARWLMDTHGLRGELSSVGVEDGAVAVVITRPGTTETVAYDLAGTTAQVTTRTLFTLGMLNRLHHIGGVAHDYWALNAWGWFLFAVSAGLLVLGSTGIWMWFRRHQQRRSGLIVVVAGAVSGLALLVLVRLG